MDDFLTRLKRYGQMATSASGLAARLSAEKYLGYSMDHNAYANHLKTFLGNVKGPVMKVAQFLATIPGALPPEYQKEFESLQNNAPPMGLPFVKRRMANELGPDWQMHFKEFDLTPSFAASLGQVHKAVTIDGTLVACKLQYPAMKEIIAADLNQLHVFLSFYEKYSQAIETQDIQEEIKEKLAQEIDYDQEAKHLGWYAHIFKDYSPIHVPAVLNHLSTSQLLTMTWMEGTRVLNQDYSQDQCDQLGALLFHGWYYPFYHFGIIHGDPHPGNYTVTKDLDLNLMDFGCVRQFSPEFIEGVILLYRSLLHNDQEQTVYAYSKWGFKNLSKDLIEIITKWARLLYDPLLDDRIRPIQEDSAGEKGWQIATEVHRMLHENGGIRPPREFVFMDRAAVGIGSVIMRLGSQQNWHQLFEGLIEGFSPDYLRENQTKLSL